MTHRRRPQVFTPVVVNITCYVVFATALLPSPASDVLHRHPDSSLPVSQPATSRLTTITQAQLPLCLLLSGTILGSWSTVGLPDTEYEARIVRDQGVLTIDRHVVLKNAISGVEVNVSEAVVELVLPGVARRFGISKSLL